MPYTVRQIVSMGRVVKVSRFMPFRKSDIDVVNNVMREMDVIEFERRQFNTLSGGEKQRVKLAAALAQEPKILLLDEPTSQLDMGHGVKVMELIQKLNRERGITIVIVSHDIQLMSSFLDRIIMMKNGSVIADGTPEEIINAGNIKTVYNCDAEIYRDNSKRIHIFPLPR
jgi:iron complex transport system ATP-binding protein